MTSPAVATHHAPQHHEPQYDYADYCADLARICGIAVGEVEADDDLRDLGLDSIRLLALQQAWLELGRKISLADVAAHPTVAGCARRLGLAGVPE